MYVLFAVVSSLLVYALLLLLLRRGGQTTVHAGRVAVLSVLVLAAGLVVFNFASRAAGIDLGPFRPVSYNIPGDYLALGPLGILALVPYALACLSPALALALPGGRR